MAADLLAFFIALFASLMLVVPVRALALRVGMVDLPGPRKVHLTPIPLLGGLAMYAAVVMAVLLAFNGPARAQIVGILIGATLVAGVGILDDRGLLHHQVKLFVGMPLAAAILLVSGIRAQVFSVLVGGRGGGFLGDDFPLAARAAAFCDAREGPRCSSPFESRSRPPRRRSHPLCARRRRRRRRRSGQLSFRANGFLRWGSGLWHHLWRRCVS